MGFASSPRLMPSAVPGRRRAAKRKCVRIWGKGGFAASSGLEVPRSLRTEEGSVEDMRYSLPLVGCNYSMGTYKRE